MVAGSNPAEVTIKKNALINFIKIINLIISIRIMKKNILLQSHNFISSILVLLISSTLCFGQIYSNGNLSTGALSKSGIASPSGYTWSELQNDLGNTTETNKSSGFAGYFNTAGTSNFQLADDFIVPEFAQWNITSFDFFAHQNSFLGTTIPVDQLRIQIWNGDPSLPTSMVVAGDMTTNVLDATNSENSFMYRIPNSIIGSPVIAPNTNRKIWKIRGNITTTLTSGTYWVVYQFHATDNTTIFVPSITVVNSRGLAGWNSKQNFIANTTPGTVLGWRSIVDSGDPTTAADIAQDLPFLINVATLGTIENNLLSTLVIYPNPAKNQLSFNKAFEKPINLEIFDITGRKVKQVDYTDSTIDISELSSGNYILKITSGNVTSIKKFIKQ